MGNIGLLAETQAFLLLIIVLFGCSVWTLVTFLVCFNKTFVKSDNKNNHQPEF